MDNETNKFKNNEEMDENYGKKLSKKLFKCFKRNF